MTRGKKPEAAIAEAKLFAERMGYRWIENPHKDLPYDLQIFKPASFRVVKIRLTRYHIDPNGFYDQQFPDEIAGLSFTAIPAIYSPRALAAHPARAGLAPAYCPRSRGLRDRMVGAG